MFVFFFSFRERRNTDYTVKTCNAIFQRYYRRLRRHHLSRAYSNNPVTRIHGAGGASRDQRVTVGNLSLYGNNNNNNIYDNWLPEYTAILQVSILTAVFGQQ